jgi:hypothetical protein
MRLLLLASALAPHVAHGTWSTLTIFEAEGLGLPNAAPIIAATPGAPNDSCNALNAGPTVYNVPRVNFTAGDDFSVDVCPPSQLDFYGTLQPGGAVTYQFYLHDAPKPYLIGNCSNVMGTNEAIPCMFGGDNLWNNTVLLNCVTYNISAC